MKLVILAPTPDYEANAGARIRYGRIASSLADAGIIMTIEYIGSFDPLTAVCDVVVVSKCYDGRALVVAAILSRRGVKVGIDVFDDYFSQNADSRLNRFRAWLRQIVDMIDFALCSTTVTAAVIARHAPGLPVHLLNDPAPSFDKAVLAANLREKLSEARDSGRIRLGWFGIGDNPIFPVGLSDVSAFASMIRSLASNVFAVELSILTNVRSLDATRLAMIANLPAMTTVNVWSEEQEKELLRASLLCFLPVNAQHFSAAKSLNRAITALCGGCQILSVGYPLYAPLEPLVYRDATNFLDDLDKANMRLSRESLGTLEARIEEFASPAHEAHALANFLDSLPHRVNSKDTAGEPIYLIHGVATNAAAHDMVKAAGGLSVGSPFCKAPLDFDVLFEAGPGKQLAMLVSETLVSRMARAQRKSLIDRERIAGRKYWEVPEGRPGRKNDAAGTGSSLPLQFARYPSVMLSIIESLGSTFGAGRTLFSENSPVPFEPAV